MSFLPEMDRNYLKEKAYAYEEIVDGAQKGVVFRKWGLPAGKFNESECDLLILLPNGYNDVKPDMFYVTPKLVLNGSNALPKATQATHQFNNVSWQRWSRHFDKSEWRPGVDGLHTYLKRVQEALVSAA